MSNFVSPSQKKMQVRLVPVDLDKLKPGTRYYFNMMFTFDDNYAYDGEPERIEIDLTSGYELMGSVEGEYVNKYGDTPNDTFVFKNVFENVPNQGMLFARESHIPRNEIINLVARVVDIGGDLSKPINEFTAGKLKKTKRSNNRRRKTKRRHH